MTIRQIFEENGGVLRLRPTWVPRSFCRPGKRIKLYPEDYYALGLERGGIDERWLASTTRAENGPGTPDDEGLSYVAETEEFLLAEGVEALRGDLVGEAIYGKYRGWPMFSKFFDNAGPLPHHIHHREEHAARVGAAGKPEMYFFPSQLNNHGGEFPFTFFGLAPGTSKEDLRRALNDFPKGDNRILDLSLAYRLEPDTGWDVPPGVLHAPGSLCTYEPQFASDVYAMYQSVLYGGQCVSEELLWKDCPAEERGNVDYLLDVVDWEINTDPDFKRNRMMKPVFFRGGEGWKEEKICYLCPLVSASRLTLMPGASVLLRDAGAYGLIALQGFGSVGGRPLETPTLIRYGELTLDEYFVSARSAEHGVEFVNRSQSQPLVILKHFAGYFGELK